MAETEGEGNLPPIPFILRGEYFTIVKQNTKGDNVTAQCKLCSPQNGGKMYNGGLKSTTNFLNHLKRAHVQILSTYEENKKEDAKKRRCQPRSSSGQTNLNFFVASDPHKNISKLDKLLTRFIVQGMHPLATIEQPEFVELVKGLDPKAKVPSRYTISRRIEEHHFEMITSLTKVIETLKYVCITADAWTCKGMSRSFMGCTVHWITDGLERKSSALACRRFTGVHSYDKIAALILSITNEYKIPLEKIVKAITDSGTNFVKAFREYSVNSHQDSIDGEGLYAMEEENEDLTDEDFESIVFENLDEVLLLGNNVDELFDQEPLIKLPPHHKCSSHKLSLICTTDISKKSPRICKLAFEKCKAIWNKASRSTKAAEKVKQICGKALTKPCETRWNSMYDSLRVLLKIKDKLKSICVSLNVSVLEDRDIEFIEEYCKCMKPIAEALDRLQGENNTFYGELIPTLLAIKKKLGAIESTRLLHWKSLPKLLMESIQTRFGPFIDLESTHHDAILAAVTHPFFKLRWLPPDKVDSIRKLFIDTMVSSYLIQFQESTIACVATNNTTTSSFTPCENTDNYFEFEAVVEQAPQHQGSSESRLQMQCFEFLNDPSKELCMLGKYPEIKDMFLKYNTPLPSYASVERVFNYCGMILEPRRRALSDRLFEKLTLLKVNRY